MVVFEDSDDSMVDYIKKNLSNVDKPLQGKAWGPVVPPNHPVMEAMMALPAQYIHSMHPAFPHAIPTGV